MTIQETVCATIRRKGAHNCHYGRACTVYVRGVDTPLAYCRCGIQVVRAIEEHAGLLEDVRRYLSRFGPA